MSLSIVTSIGYQNLQLLLNNHAWLNSYDLTNNI